MKIRNLKALKVISELPSDYTFSDFIEDIRTFQKEETAKQIFKELEEEAIEDGLGYAIPKDNYIKTKKKYCKEVGND